MLVVCVVVRAVVFVLVGAQAFLVSDVARANVVMTTVLASASAAVVLASAAVVFAAGVLASTAVVFAAGVLASTAGVLASTAGVLAAGASTIFSSQGIVHSIVIHACGQKKFSTYTLK